MTYVFCILFVLAVGLLWLCYMAFREEDEATEERKTIWSLVVAALVAVIGCSVILANGQQKSCIMTICAMYVVGILLIVGLRILYQGTLHSIFLTWSLDEVYQAAIGESSDSDRYRRALRILGVSAALVAVYWSRLPGIDALITRMAAGVNGGCVAIAARMIASPASDPDKYQQALNHPDALTGAGVMQYGFGLLMLWGLWSFYSGSLHSILLTWFLHNTYSEVTRKKSEGARYRNAIRVLEILTSLVAIYFSRLPGIDSAVGGVMSVYRNMFMSLFGG